MVNICTSPKWGWLIYFYVIQLDRISKELILIDENIDLKIDGRPVFAWLKIMEWKFLWTSPHFWELQYNNRIKLQIMYNSIQSLNSYLREKVARNDVSYLVFYGNVLLLCRYNFLVLQGISAQMSWVTQTEMRIAVLRYIRPEVRNHRGRWI